MDNRLEAVIAIARSLLTELESLQCRAGAAPTENLSLDDEVKRFEIALIEHRTICGSSRNGVSGRAQRSAGRFAEVTLSEKDPARNSFITQIVNFADRTDVDSALPDYGIVDKHLDTRNGLVFMSDHWRNQQD